MLPIVTLWANVSANLSFWPPRHITEHRFSGHRSARLAASFAGVFRFDEGFQIGEVRAPEGAILLDPRIDGTQRLGVKLIHAMSAFPVLANQMRTAKQAQVFGNGRAGNRESFGDLAGRLAAAAQQVKHGAACRIGEGLEGRFGCSRGRMCNRTVTHNM
jgi:hypothetical protein